MNPQIQKAKHTTRSTHGEEITPGFIVTELHKTPSSYKPLQREGSSLGKDEQLH